MGTGLSKSSMFKSLEKRFDAEELYTLRQTFSELASRHGGRFIDRDTFKLVFRMPGVLSDWLFNAFDPTGSGIIDYESFITGLALFVRGELDERLEFLFRIYDIDKNGRITREGLTTVLNSVLFAGYLIISSQWDPERISDSISDVISKRTKKLVDDAFKYQESDALTKEQFRRWARDNSIEVECALDVLIRDRNTVGQRSSCGRQGSSFDLGRLTFDDILRSPSRSPPHSPSRKFSESNSSFSHGNSFQYSLDVNRVQPRRPDLSEFADKSGVHITCRSCSYDISACYCACCGSPLKTRDNLLSCSYCISDNRSVKCQFCLNCGADLQPVVSNDDDFEPVFGEMAVDGICGAMEGYLYKREKNLRISSWNQTWCRLAGNFLYTYRSRISTKLTGMICLENAYIERVDQSKLHSRMRFGLQIYSPINRLKRCFYAATEREREDWHKALRRAARQFCFEDYYTIDGKIGEGKFAHVYSCTRKKNNQKYAVKIINKYDIRECDRDGLRTEVAILQFVHHPNIVHLKNVFETHSRMYIVMSLVQGGDLFQRLKERGHYCEDDARKVMTQLLRAIQYLHERGIVHRDLKPENIMLTTESPTNIQIVDFGLSKFIAPEEKINQTCGTLSYLAPEVLLRKGYGREVDVWSVGVILYVMLCCRFPFPDSDVKQYLNKALFSDFSFEGEDWELVSDEAKSLIARLLNPNPRERIGVDEALDDPWFQLTDTSAVIPSRSTETTRSSSRLTEVSGIVQLRSSSVTGEDPGSSERKAICEIKE